MWLTSYPAILLNWMWQVGNWTPIIFFSILSYHQNQWITLVGSRVEPNAQEPLGKTLQCRVSQLGYKQFWFSSYSKTGHLKNEHSTFWTLNVQILKGCHVSSGQYLIRKNLTIKNILGLVFRPPFDDPTNWMLDLSGYSTDIVIQYVGMTRTL